MILIRPNKIKGIVTTIRISVDEKSTYKVKDASLNKQLHEIGMVVGQRNPILCCMK